MRVWKSAEAQEGDFFSRWIRAEEQGLCREQELGLSSDANIS